MNQMEDWRDCVQRGQKSRSRGDWEGLLEASDEMVELKPGEAIAWDYRGEAYHKLGHLHSALPAYMEAERLRPGWTNGECERVRNLLFKQPVETTEEREASETIEWKQQTTALERSLERLNKGGLAKDALKRRLSGFAEVEGDADDEGE